MSCVYTYKGVPYTYQEIKEILPVEKEEVNSEAAKTWLQDKLSMSDNEVSIVKGLVENKALGQFQEDGKILLSELASESIAYHEAFHRVFQLYLKPEQRQSLIKEFKSRPDAKSLIKLYSEEYKGLSEDKVIEEIIAEEFREYVMTNQSTKPQAKSWFDALIDWIKKMLGISKNYTSSELFKKINKAGFKDTKPLPAKYINPIKSNMLAFTVDNNSLNLSEAETKDLMEGLNQLFFFQLFRQNFNPYKLTEGLDVNKIYTDSFINMSIDIFNHGIKLNNPRLQDIGQSLKAEANQKEVKRLHARYLKEFGLEVEEIDESDVKGRNAPDWINATEISSKERMSKQVKMLLSAVPVVEIKDGKTIPSINNLGLKYVENPKKITDLLLNKLAQIPATPENFINELIKIADTHPIVKPIIKYIGGKNYDPTVNPLWKTRLRFDFVQQFGKTRYTYLIQQIGKDGSIKNINANEESTTKAIQKQWRSNLETSFKDKGVFDSNVEYWSKSKNPDYKEIGNLFGIVLHDSLYNNDEVQKELIAILTQYKNNKAKLKSPTDFYNSKVDRALKVDGRLNKLAQLQLPFYDGVELQVTNSDGKTVYGISLNTYQTLLTDMLNYYSEQGMEKTKQELPFMFNPYTKSSKVLEGIFKRNKKITYSLQDGTKNELGDSISTDRPSETTLWQNRLNNLYIAGTGTLKGRFMSIKHADRGVFPVFSFSDDSLFVADNFVNQTTDIFVEYLKDEIEKAQYDMGENKFINYKPKTRSFFQDYIDDALWNKLVNLKSDFTKDNETIYNAVKSQIKQKIEAEIKQNKNELDEYGLLKPYKGTKTKTAKKHIGIDNRLLEYYSLDDIISAFTVNDLIWKVEQIKLYTGELTIYKSMEDFYKRLNTQSSSGEIAIVDTESNTGIEALNKQTEKEFGVKYNKTINGRLGNVSLKDAEYASKNYEDIKKVFLNYFNDSKKAERYAKPYKGYTEPDGFSMINLFELREFLYRSAKWSDGHQIVFDKEMQIQKLIQDGASKQEIQQKIEDLYDLTDEFGNPINAKEYIQNMLQPFVVEKPQYSGPVFYDANYEEDPNITGILKTSIFPLIPSLIYGTNLEKINTQLINSGQGIYSYDSATKTGIFEPNNSYIEKDGKYVMNEDFGKARELDYRFMKMQLAISHIPKNKIISATQSTKMMMANQYEKALPVDFNGTKEDWDKLSEAEKIKTSELHALNVRYQDLFSELINRNVVNLVNELEATVTKYGDFKPTEYQLQNITKLKEVLKAQAESRLEPLSIMDAIDTFIKGNFIESLPNSQKLWSIVNSIVTNKVIKLKRTGTSLPQIASTMWESAPREKKTIGKDSYVQSSDLLKFYEVKFDSNDNVTEVTPAEMIMPLPTEWIEPAFEAFKTQLKGSRSLPKLIDLINEGIEKGEIDTLITTKALRIPNQQFSSNDILRVKKFTNPAAGQQFVIVPSEIVAKTGGDFDIDKMNIYFKNITKDFKEIKYSDNVEEQYKKQFKIKNFLNYFKTKKGYEDFKSSISKRDTERLLYAVFQEIAEEDPQSDLIDLNLSYDNNIKNLEELAKEEAKNVPSLEVFKLKPNIERNSVKAIENELIDVETQILLHPKNAYQLFSAVDDAITKEDGFKAARGKTYKEFTEVQSKSLSDVLSAKNDTDKTMQFMGGSIGIGIVATSSTNHNYGQVVDITLNLEYTPELFESGKKVRNPLKTTIPIEINLDTDRSLGLTENEVKDNISDIISALITSQVDMVKDPYASLMFLTTQTFPIALFMIRRGYSLQKVVKFLGQNSIQDYLLQERINNSPLYKSTGKKSTKNPNGLQLSREDLALFVKNKYPQAEQIINFTEAQLGENNPNYQRQLLDLFLNIKQQASSFDDFKKVMSPDTKTLKNFEEAKEWEELKDDVVATKIVENPKDTIKSVKIVDSYIKGHNLYYGLFHTIALSEYPKAKAQLDLVKPMFKQTWKMDDAAKMNQSLTSALISYVLQTQTSQKNKFDKLFRGDSVAKRILKLQKTTDNLAIKELLPLINTLNDSIDLVKLKNIRYTALELESLQREMLRLKETNEELYNDIVVANMYQSSAGYNPYSITQIIPNELNKRINDEIMNLIKTDGVNYADFRLKVPLALPKLLATSYDAKGRPFQSTDEGELQVVMNGKTYKPIGTQYYINWNADTDVIDIQDPGEGLTEYDFEDYSLPEPTAQPTVTKMGDITKNEDYTKCKK
jgi:hypothetical protein